MPEEECKILFFQRHIAMYIIVVVRCQDMHVHLFSFGNGNELKLHCSQTAHMALVSCSWSDGNG